MERTQMLMECKINILLNFIGPARIKVYNNFKKYCELIRILCIKSSNSQVTCVQLEGQGFDNLVTELKKLASICSFKEEDNMVPDCIIVSIRNMEPKDSLISFNNLTLEKVEEMCQTSEATKKKLREMVSSTSISAAAYLQTIK